MVLTIVGANFGPNHRGPHPEARETVSAGLRLGAMLGQKLVARSGATLCAMRVLAQSPTPPRALACMRLLRVLSKAAENAAEIVHAEAFPFLLARLDTPLGEPTLALAVECIWNLLDHQLAATCERVASADVVAILTRLHERTLAPNSCDTDKELRNEVVVLGTLLAQGGAPMREALVHGGFFGAALQLVCGDGTKGVTLITPSLVNLELVQLTLHFLQVRSHYVTSRYG